VFENVAEYVDEAVRLAERCPEKYQIPCFEALIRVLAQSDSPLPQNGNGHPSIDSAPGNGHSNGEAASTQSNGTLANGSYTGLDGQQTIGERGAIFLDQHQLPGASISRVYHLDGNSYRIIVKEDQLQEAGKTGFAAGSRRSAGWWTAGVFKGTVDRSLPRVRRLRRSQLRLTHEEAAGHVHRPGERMVADRAGPTAGGRGDKRTGVLRILAGYPAGNTFRFVTTPLISTTGPGSPLG